MRTGLTAACIAALSLGASIAFAQNEPKPSRTEKQNDCKDAVLTDYHKRGLELLLQKPTPSVDGEIAGRRREEEFCLRFIQCSLDDQNTLIFAVAFYSCLEKESLEKYDAIPRDEVPDRD
jgi:hypothetical protein